MNIEVYMVVFMEKKWSYIALWKGDIGHHVGGTHSFQFGKEVKIMSPGRLQSS